MSGPASNGDQPVHGSSRGYKDILAQAHAAQHNGDNHKTQNGKVSSRKDSSHHNCGNYNAQNININIRKTYINHSNAREYSMPFASPLQFLPSAQQSNIEFHNPLESTAYTLPKRHVEQSSSSTPQSQALVPSRQTKPSFENGRIFSLPRSVSPGETDAPAFVVIHAGSGKFLSVPIVTYDPHRLGQFNDEEKAKHAIVYSGRTPPTLPQHELARRAKADTLSEPIRVDLDPEFEGFAEHFRISFGRLAVFDSKIEARFIGFVHAQSMKSLKIQFGRAYPRFAAADLLDLINHKPADVVKMGVDDRGDEEGDDDDDDDSDGTCGDEEDDD
ncbi:hypothetical protein Q7P37_001128 [Cladosporium fusiforme]